MHDYTYAHMCGCKHVYIYICLRVWSPQFRNQMYFIYIFDCVHEKWRCTYICVYEPEHLCTLKWPFKYVYIHVRTYVHVHSQHVHMQLAWSVNYAGVQACENIRAAPAAVNCPKTMLLFAVVYVQVSLSAYQGLVAQCYLPHDFGALLAPAQNYGVPRFNHLDPLTPLCLFICFCMYVCMYVCNEFM